MYRVSLLVLFIQSVFLAAPGVISGAAPPGAGPAALEEVLARSAAQANEAFARCDRYLSAWTAKIDTETGLLPQNLSQGRGIWTPENSAADNFPFMVIAARFVRPELADSILWRALLGEKRFTLDRFGLPSAYDFNQREKLARPLESLIFGASEYAKDGIVPMLEILGPGVWSERMKELALGIFEAAPVETGFGRLPSADSEVNGEMLQVLCKLYWMTGDERFLEWAERIGDAYCYEVMPASAGLPVHNWDFQAHRGDGRFRLRDHGCEILSGLCLLFAIEAEKKSSRAASYYSSVKRMLDRVMEIGADSGGIFFNEVDVQTGEVTQGGLSDCWGYDYYGYYTFYLATGEERYREHVQRALGNINHYRDYRWEPRADGSQSQDGYADAIEGALGLLSFCPSDSAFAWVETEIKRMFAFQKEDGIIEGWHGDGNFARTALMYAFFKTKGAYCTPWRKDLLLGAELSDGGLEVMVRAEKPWSGRVCFDPPRHRLYLGMSRRYPTINAFPEWYTVEPLGVYKIERAGKEAERVIGDELIQGYRVRLAGGQSLRIRVEAGDR